MITRPRGTLVLTFDGVSFEDFRKLGYAKGLAQSSFFIFQGITDNQASYIGPE